MITLTGNSGRYYFDEQKDRLNSGRKFNHVYKGTDEQNNPVLIKQLLPGLQNDPVATQRFKNEFDLQVQHPNIIAARDHFIHYNQHYLVRDWVEGKDLTHTLHRTGLQQSIAICTEVLKALNHLHVHNILHLDVQPKNIIIGSGSRVYLTDLGLARRISEAGQRQPFNIGYSAPEQILNRQHLVNATTDLFAAGMILLELVNKSKFQVHTNPEILMNLVLASPVTNHKQLHETLFQVIEKATSKPRFNLPPTHYDVAQLDEMIVSTQAIRYQRAQDFIDALRQIPSEALMEKKWWKPW